MQPKSLNFFRLSTYPDIWSLIRISAYISSIFVEFWDRR